MARYVTVERGSPYQPILNCLDAALRIDLHAKLGKLAI
jgi:hypothetical protein